MSLSDGPPTDCEVDKRVDAVRPPLEGVRIVDLSRVLAGRTADEHIARLGAEGAFGPIPSERETMTA